MQLNTSYITGKVHSILNTNDPHPCIAEYVDEIVRILGEYTHHKGVVIVGYATDTPQIFVLN